MSGLLLLVLGVLGFRIALGLVPYFKDNMVSYLNEKLNTRFEVGELDARWGGGMPSLLIRNLTLKARNTDQAAFEVDRLDAVLDLKASLLSLEPVFSYLEADDIALRIESDSDGVWSLKGIHYIRDDSKDFNLDRLLQLIQLQKYIDITNFQLSLFPYDREPVYIEQRHLSLDEEAGQKKLSARYQTSSGELIVRAEGTGVERRTMDWSGSVSANNLNLGLICRFITSCDQFQSARLSTGFDWHFRKGKWYQKGLFYISDINYATEKEGFPEYSLVSEFQVHGDVLAGFSNWQLQLDDLELQQDNDFLTGFDLSLAKLKEKEPAYSLDIDRLALKEAGLFLQQAELMPKRVNSLLDTLKPEGHLNQLSLQYYPERSLREQMKLSAGLQQISVDAWKGAPSGENVNGQLNMGMLDGTLELDTADLRLGLRRIFRDVWQYDTAKATLRWDVPEGENVYILESNNIQMTAPEGKLSGVLKLDIPLSRQKPINMDLDVTLTEGDARYAGKYLPALSLSPKLVEWLDTSIKGAQVNEGHFSWHGSLGSEDTDGSEWGLFFDVEKARFDYAERWPEIYQADGRVWADSKKVKVELDSARAYGASLADASAVVELNEKADLMVSSRLKATGNDLMQFFTQSPVGDVLGQEVNNWDLQGDLEGALLLNLPLNDLAASKVSVTLDTEQALFRHKKANLTVDQIQGRMEYSTDHGITAENLKARLFDSPVAADIQSEVDAEKMLTTIDWSGDISVDALQQWLKLDALSLLEGSAAYKAQLTLGGKNPLDVNVTSHLNGIALELPKPFDIPAAAEYPAKLNFTLLADGRQRLLTDVAGLGSAEVSFDQHFQLSSALVNLGDKATAVKAKEGRVTLTGQIEELDLEPWYERLKSQPVGNNEKSMLRWLEVKALTLDKLRYKDFNLNNLQFGLEQKGGQSRSLSIHAHSDELDGTLVIPEDANKPHQLVMNRLYIPVKEKTGKDIESQSDALENFDPRVIPDFDITIRELKLGDKKPGSLSVQLRDAPGGKKAESLNAVVHGMDIQGDLDWLFISGQARSRFHGSLSGSGIRQFQKAAGLSPFVSAQRSRLDAELKWLGSPANINMSSLEGTLRLNLKDGKMHKLEGGAGALKLFGIFNMEALTRRLRLDFSDLYSQGISFDRINGALRFDKGMVSFEEPLIVQGPSSDFKLSGTVDTEQSTMDISLVVTLPVTSNLPILSVLLGTAPQVAGIIYIADKLVGDQVDQLASIRYRIEGSLDQPEVSLDRLFAGDTKKTEKKN